MKTKICKHCDFNIEYYQNDQMAIGSIGSDKLWEPHILNFTKKYNELFNIKNIIDVGANFGYHTLFFSKLIENNGFVFAFEPQIQNYTLLYNNIHSNNIRNVHIYQQACSDELSNVYLPLIVDSGNRVNMGDFTLNYEKTNTHMATAVPIDSFIFPKIDLIKIDVQGWELKTLSGAKELIQRDKPILIVEFEEHQLNKTNNTCSYLFNLIRDMNYYIYYLDYEYPADHVCVHKDNIDIFEQKFKSYIFDHNILNRINCNINHGVNKKIKI